MRFLKAYATHNVVYEGKSKGQKWRGTGGLRRTLTAKVTGPYGQLQHSPEELGHQLPLARDAVPLSFAKVITLLL